MTTTELPAAVLRRAAARLRDLKDQATPGTWEPVTLLDGRRQLLSDSGDTYVLEDSFADDHDLNWIATVGPHVGFWLAQWLDSAATREGADFDSAAVYFARTLLGEEAGQ